MKNFLNNLLHVGLAAAVILGAMLLYRFCLRGKSRWLKCLLGVGVAGCLVLVCLLPAPFAQPTRDGKDSASDSSSQTTSVSTFAAVVEDVYDGSMLVTIYDGANRSMKAYISTSDLQEETNPVPQAGDWVQVTYDGIDLESYPLQIPNVYEMERIDPLTETVRFYVGSELTESPFMDSSHILSATAGYSEEIGYFVQLTFTQEGKEIFADITAQNLGSTLSIWCEDTLLTNPTIETEITDGQAVISGADMTREYTQDLAKRIEKTLWR